MVSCARVTRGLRRKGRERPGAIFARRAESGRVACWSPVLAQRAVSEDPRWTRAVGDQAGHPPVKRKDDKRVWKDQLDG